MDLFSYLLGKKSSGGGGGGLDWSAIGYSKTPQAVSDAYNYAKQIYDNWDNTQTDLSQKFRNDLQMVFMPLVDTSKVTSMANMFYGCNSLIQIPLLDTSGVKGMNYMFSGCGNLSSIPLFDTSSVTIMGGMFEYCYKLTTIPLLNTSKMVNMNNMINGCKKLTDTSLDNILQMCINTTSAYTQTKTLARLGFTSSNYPTTRIQALPHYQDFINAGWTIGY